MAQSDNTYESIAQNIKKRSFAPIYLLMGEEAFFIDALTDMLLENVLNETEKDFNLTIFYGTDSNVNNIIASAKRYPMMSDYQLIVVREAQKLDNIDLIGLYAKQPMPSTILVLNYKYGNIDKRKSIIKEIEKAGGVVFASKRVYENKIPAFITSYFRSKQLTIEPKAAQMITDFVGSDLTKLSKELEKLTVSLPKGEMRITSDLVEKNVGISKEFNNFELLKSVITKDHFKANQILNYFEKDPKNNPQIVTIIVLFNFFSKLIDCYWLKDRSEQSVMTALNLKSSFFVKDYMQALSNYNVRNVMNIISLLREYDGKLKGVNTGSTPPHQLMRELVFKIMH